MSIIRAYPNPSLGAVGAPAHRSQNELERLVDVQVWRWQQSQMKETSMPAIDRTAVHSEHEEDALHQEGN